MRLRDTEGRFARQRLPWTPDRWDEGYTDNHGRFRVYRPDYPRCWADGYAFRYAVAYWLQTGRIPEDDLHHENGDRTDDRPANLAPMEHAAHARGHNPKTMLTCIACGKLFPRPHHKSARSTKYCSQVCYHAMPRSPESRRLASLHSRHAGKTHCPHGHPYDDENTGWYHGARFCKTCRRNSTREWRLRRCAS